METNILIHDGMRCNRCRINNYDSPDGLCNNCRRILYDHRECECGKRMEDERGWYVPEFGSYGDVSYYCPDCIEKYQKEYHYKNKRLKEIPIELKKLQENLPLDPSPIIFDKGKYFYRTLDGVSFNQFKKDLDYYKKNKDAIEKVRKEIRAIRRKIEKLKEEEEHCFIGSGFFPMPNR